MNEQVQTISIVYDGKNIMPCITDTPITQTNLATGETVTFQD